MIFEFQQPRFTEGVLAKSLQGRSPEEFYNFGVKTAQNMIPLIEGPMIKRPGTVYVSEAGNSTSKLFPFYKGGTEAYVVEVGYDNTASDTTLVCSTTATDKTVTVTTGNTNTIFKGQHVWNANLDALTGYPTTNLDNSSQVASITDSTHFELTNAALITGTTQTLNFSNKPFIRIYSQDKLLNVYNTITPYVVKSHRWILDSFTDELSNLRISQSGDVLFFTCPTRTPFLLSRTLEPATTLRAEDNSVWTLSEYVAEDGPYQNTNSDNELSVVVTGALTQEEIADVTFDVKDNLVVVSNHGLQAGQKINLFVNDITSDITGNTQIIIKNGTVDPTITTLCTASDNSGEIKFTTTSSHGLMDNDIIHLGGTTLPTGTTPVLTSGTDYYICDAAYTSFQISTTEDGADKVAITGTAFGSADLFFGSNKTTSYGPGDPLLGDTAAGAWSDGQNNTFYVVYSTSTTFQISDTPSNKSFDIGYRDHDSSVPPVTGVQFSGKCTLKRYKHAAGIDITLKSRIKLSTGSWAYSTVANGGLTFSSGDIGRMIRINPLADPSTRRGGIRWGWGKITAVHASNVYECTVTLETDLSPNPDETNGSPEWRLGAFSGYTNYATGTFYGNGYPKISQIYQQRFVFATTSYEPSTVWLSRSGNFYNYAPTELSLQDSPVIIGGVTTEVITDSNSLTFTIDSDTLDEIKWLVDSKKLAMGTSAGVYFLYGSETNLSVVPTRFTVNRETSFSASDVQPVIVSNVIIYPQRGGREVQELEFSGAEDQWLQSRISMKAYDMISTSSITKIAWQERPNPIIWMIMDNGQVLTLSYDRSVKFKAWSVHTIGGAYQGGIAKVMDIAIIPRTAFDQVWLKVRRTINSVDVDYIEKIDRFPSESAVTRNELVFLDSAKIHRDTEIFPLSTDIPTVDGIHAIDVTTLNVQGATSAPPANTRFLIAGDTTIYKIVSASSSAWVLDQGLVAAAADDAPIELRLQQLTIDHLKKESIGLCTNGMEHVNKTVGHTGATEGLITLDHALSSTAVSGLSYVAQMETLSPPTPDNQYTYNKKLLTLTALIQESLGVELAYNDVQEEMLFRSTQQNTGEPIDFFTGFRKQSLSGIGFSTHNVVIRSISPLPMQINAVTIEVETGGA